MHLKKEIVIYTFAWPSFYQGVSP